MKILYHHRIASKDGQYVHVEELTRALKERGHELIMVAPGMTGGDFGSEGGLVPWLKKYIPKFIYELLELGYAWFAYIKLARAVKQYQPDCLYERYNLFMPAGVWIKKRFGLPMLSEVNAPIFEERNKYDGIALKALARWSENYVWRGADVVLPVTQVLAGYIKKARSDHDSIHVIANGINLERFAHPPDAQAAKVKLGLNNKLVLGFTGFVREWHGLERVLTLIAKHQSEDWHLLLVGDGPARKSIESQADKLNISDRLTITGVISRDRIIDYVSAFDIALQPDVVSYASPLKLFEYMILARAIIAPDTSNIREVLSHQMNALLFNPEQDDGFLQAIETLCDDAELRHALAQNARQTIFSGHYTWSDNAMKVEDLILQLLDRDAK